MINEQYKYSELTSRIIGCAMTVHKTLGNGFQEVIYQRALDIEMNMASNGSPTKNINQLTHKNQMHKTASRQSQKSTKSTFRQLK